MQRDTFTSNSAEAESTLESLFCRIEGCPAVSSHDGQAGALLREVAKLGKFGSDTIATLNAACWDVQQLSAGVAAALVTCTLGEGGNPSPTSPQRRPWKRSPLLARGHTMGQAPISGGTNVVNGTTHIAQAYDDRERAPSRGHAVGVDTR